MLGVCWRKSDTLGDSRIRWPELSTACEYCVTIRFEFDMHAKRYDIRD